LRIGPGAGSGSTDGSTDSNTSSGSERAIGGVESEGGAGALAESGGMTAASAWTEGAKTVLFMRVDFSDMPGEPVDVPGNTLTVARAQSIIADDNNFYKANSYNKTSITGTVTKVLRMPKTAAFYGGQDSGVLLTDARAAALAAGYPNTHNLDIVAFKKITAFAWAGLGYVGGKGTWLNR